MATMFTGGFVLFCLLKTRKGTKWHSRGKKYTWTDRHPSWKRPKRTSNGTAVTGVITRTTRCGTAVTGVITRTTRPGTAVTGVITRTTRRETWQAGISWTVILGTAVPGTGARQTRTPWTGILGTAIPRTADSGRRQRTADTMKAKYQL